MGVLSHVKRGAMLPAVALVGITLAGTTGCDPDEDRGLTPIGAAFTTDKVATKALERGGIKVRWMSCTGDAKGKHVAGSSHPPLREVDVDCQGRAEKGDADITVDGVVTYVRKGKCVKGDLTAKVADRRVFRAKVIGECGGSGGSTGRGSS